MHWLQIDDRLKKLYNAITTAHSDTVSFNTAMNAELEAQKIMEELTIELEKLK
jgi:hypothetical protein